MNFLSALGLALLAVLFLGCGEFVGPPKGMDPTFDKDRGGAYEDLYFDKFTDKKMIADLLQDVVGAHLGDFVKSLSQMQSAVEVSCRDNSFDEQLQASWKKAMLAYHRLEPMQVGSLAKDDYALMENFYSWSEANTCAVDTEVKKLKGQDSPVLSSEISRRGLDAIEYLIYDEDLNHSCPRRDPELREWNRWSDLQKRQLRCQYLQMLSEDLVKQAENLKSIWQKSRKSSRSEQAWIQDFVSALFYVEKASKDHRLGIPLGLSKADEKCQGQYCFHKEEHPHSGLLVESLKANLEGLEALFRGSKNKTKKVSFAIFHKLVNSQQKPLLQLVNKLDQHMDQLEKRLSAWPLQQRLKQNVGPKVDDYSLCQQSTSKARKVEACALYADFKGLTDLLKRDFVVALSTDLPVDTEGDGD